MNVYELLKQLGSSGIKLRLEGNELKFKAPKGALTKEYKEQIKANKPAIIEFLRSTKTGAAAAAQIITPVDRSVPIALSYAQQRLWFLDQLSPGDISYNIPVQLLLKGELKPDVFDRVFEEVIKRHEVLRTVFSGQADGAAQVQLEPTQTVQAFEGWTLPYYDLSREADAIRLKRLNQLVDDNVSQPFDLQKGPLFRIALIKLSDQEFHLTATLHHIISDGWSMGVLIQEVMTLYHAYCFDLESPLTPLQIQYGDFSVWQRDWLSGDVLQNQCDYWQQKLLHVPKLELPTDKVRPATLLHHGANYEFEWDSALLTALKEFSQQQGVTLFMTLLTVYKVLLYRYSGQEDFAVGTPIANRTRPELEPIIGFFVNTLALRTDLSGAPSFIELLARVQQTTLDGYSQQDLPFERVVEVSGVAREMSHTPLFQVMFVLQNASAGEFQLPGLSIESVATERLTSKFDLQLSFAESEQGLKGEIEYCTDLFESETIVNFAQHLQCLMKQVLKDPNRSIDQFDLMAPDEQQKIIQAWNNTATAYPKNKTIAELFEQQAIRVPEQIALIGPQGTLSYHQLNVRTNQLARALLSQNDFKPTLGCAIGICLERSFEQIIALLAVLKVGGAFVPLDPNYPSDRLATMLDIADVDWVLTDSKLSSIFESLNCHVFLTDEDFSSLDETHWPLTEATGISAKDRPAYIMFTSGSSGQPKGIATRQEGVVRLVQDNAFFPFDEPQVFLHYAPVVFDASTFEIWGALLNGNRLVIPEPGPFDQLLLKQLIVEYQVTTVWLTAALFHYVVEYEIELLQPLNYLLAGGDVLAPSLVKKAIREAPELTIINGYGPTENTTFTCCHTMRSVADVGRTVSIGKPISNSQVYLLDAYLKPVPVGVVGQICTAGAGVAAGYLKQDELTAQSFVANPYAAYDGHGPLLYCTGDYGRYAANGEIEFLGRMDDQVKIRGFRIELGEIETSLMRLPWVKQCVVVAKVGPGGDTVLVAYWVADSDEQESIIAQTKQQLSHSLPEYMLPAAHVLLPQLPVNRNGKVDRHALPEVEFRNTDTQHQVPRNRVETELLNIWQDLLGVSQIGIYDSFFELGGHSLLATQVTSRIRSHWQIELPLRTFFENPVIAALADFINTAQRSESQTDFRIEKLAEDDVVPASFAQQRLWLLDQLQPGSAAYNVPSAFRIRGELYVDLMEQAVNEVVNRHGALRTTFIQQGLQLNQRVAEDAEFKLTLETYAQYSAGQHTFETHYEQIQQQCHQEAVAPFDLTTGPLYRFRLIKLSEQDFVAMVTLHHIISDGWSVGIFIKELIQIYEGLKHHQAPTLATLDIQYADYAAWQQNWMVDERLEAHLDFYQQSLGDNDLVLCLPTDKPRPRFASSAGQTVSHTLSAGLSQKLSVLAQREGVSLYMLMLSAWQIILGRYSGQSKFNIGSPVAGRTRQETEALIGFFINTVVMSANVSNNPSFRALLHQTRDNVLDTFAHQDLPFEKLVEKLQPARDLSRSPVFQVFLNVLNLPNLSGEMAGLLVEDLAEEEAEYESKFDLTLYVKERADGIQLSMLYRTDCFEKQSIQNQLAQLEILLEQVELDVDAPIDSYRLAATTAPQFADDQGRRVIEQTLPQPHQLFEQCALKDPTKIAVEDLDGQWCYGDLNGYSNQLAHGIIDAGIGAGDCVAIYGHRSGALAWAILGILKSGAAFVVLDPSLPEHRLIGYLDQVDIKGALCLSRGEPCPQSLLKLFSQAPLSFNLPGLNEIATLNPCAEYSQLSPMVQRQDNDLAYVSFTSGTTGQAKAIRGSLLPLNHFIQWYSDEFEVTCDDRFSQLSGLAHDPLLRDLLVPFANHGTVCIPEPIHFAEPLKMRGWLRDNRISISHLTPSLLRLISIGRDPEEAALNSLRLIFFGGESLLLSHVREASALAPQAHCFNCYGATETPQIISYHPVCLQDLELHKKQLDHTAAHYSDQIMPVGNGAPGSQLVLLGPNKRPIGYGELGEVWVRSCFLALGYTDQNLTRQAFKEVALTKSIANESGAMPKNDFRPRWYCTGDLGRYRYDGQIEITGRGDSQIKVRGYRVEVLDVQNELRCIDSVRDCFVAVETIIHEAGDQEQQFIVAYIVGEAGRVLDSDDFRSVASGFLPDYMLPNQFIFVDAIPLNHNGKVDRDQLPLPVWHAQQDAEQALVLPQSDSERKMALIWSALLKKDPVSITGNFFELGGHSLLATELIHLIQEGFSFELPLKSIFEFPTVEKLAAYIDTLQCLQEVPEGDDYEEFEV